MFDSTANASGSPEHPNEPNREFLHDACLEALAGDETKLELLLQSADKGTCLLAIEEAEREKARCGSIQTRFADRVQQLTIQQNMDSGVHHKQLDHGAASNIALARHTTQGGAGSFLRCAHILEHDTPYLAQRFAQGDLTLEQVQSITSALESVPEVERRAFDDYYRAHPDLFDQLGHRRITDTVRQYTDRAQSEARTVSIEETSASRYIHFRKGKDCVMVSGRLPLEEGIALEQHLRAQARRAIQQGDTRTERQLICDLFVRRPLTGTADPLPLKIQLKLIMTDRSLFAADTEPAYLPGYGVIPAQYARQLLSTAEEQLKQAGSHRADLRARIKTFPEIQRLFTAPGNKDLIAMESKARIFPPALRDFIQIRDRRCRTPHCNNPASEADHIYQWHLGGPTSLANAAYRCHSCNLVKEQPDWAEALAHMFPHTITLHPAPGTSYTSQSPPATGIGQDQDPADEDPPTES